MNATFYMIQEMFSCNYCYMLLLFFFPAHCHIDISYFFSSVYLTTFSLLHVLHRKTKIRFKNYVHTYHN